MYYPLALVLKDGDTIYIGKVGPQHVVRIILNGEDPVPILEVNTNLPSIVSSSSGRIWIDFNAPSKEGPFTFCMDVKKTKGLETHCLAFDVDKNVIEVRTSDVRGREFEYSSLKAVLRNKGNGIARVDVYCDLCNKRSVTLYPHEIKEVVLDVRMPVAGSYTVKLYVNDGLNASEAFFRILSTPTVEGRLFTSKLYPDLLHPLLYPIKVMWRLLVWKM